MIHYLSVHDLVWINAIVTGRTLSFDYETLEQAMAAQYGYGDSRNVPAQAANLLYTLMSGEPFEYGNVRTAFVATAAFLNANGCGIQVDDERAAEIVQQLRRGEITPTEAIDSLAAPTDTGLRPGATLRALVTHICNAHANALKRLAEGDQ